MTGYYRLTDFMSYKIYNGHTAATNVTLTDPLPVGVTYFSAMPAQGTYDNGTELWTVGDLANGAGATLTITATLDADVDGFNSNVTPAAG